MINIAIFGFGVVGGGTAEVLTENASLIASRVGEPINIKYILDLRDFPDSPFRDCIVHDIDVILNDPEVKICAELMGGSHPAYEFSVRAMKAGKSVVTSNKEVVANFGPELLRTADECGVRYLFEASVGGGIPVIHPIGSCLTANDISEVDGILNGTTNYILTEMFTKGKDFDSALKEAQEKGYAERNPAADVDGIDACRKISILSAIAFGSLVPPEEISTEGIRGVTAEDVANAKKIGAAIKLIGRAVKVGDRISACVAPMFVRETNPLAGITGVYNGILVNGNAIGDVMFYGRGAGKLPTASAVVSDIIEIAMYLDHPARPYHVWSRLAKENILSADEIPAEFCLRFGTKPETLPEGVTILTDEPSDFAIVTGKMTPAELRKTFDGEYTAYRIL